MTLAVTNAKRENTWLRNVIETNVALIVKVTITLAQIVENQNRIYHRREEGVDEISRVKSRKVYERTLKKRGNFKRTNDEAMIKVNEISLKNGHSVSEMNEREKANCKNDS